MMIYKKSNEKGKFVTRNVNKCLELIENILYLVFEVVFLLSRGVIVSNLKTELVLNIQFFLGKSDSIYMKSIRSGHTFTLKRYLNTYCRGFDPSVTFNEFKCKT